MKVSPEKNFSINSSLVSATDSMSWSYSSSTTLTLSSGMGTSLRLLPSGSKARLWITSTTPVTFLFSSQMGTTTGATLLPKHSRRVSKAELKSMLSSSILEM